MAFENLIGNSNIKNLLINSVKNKNVLHSYLFYGTEGIGKKLFAIEFAKMILCNNEENKPCNTCKSCIEFDSNNNPDFFIIEPEGNVVKIDQIRGFQKNILEKPITSTKKVYIINEADTMTKEAQNCLLKTLEEPQEFITIILIASNENNILPTVKSRCTKIFFQNLEDYDIIKYINENFNNIFLENDMLKLCEGSISKTKLIIQKIDLLNSIKNLINEIDFIDEVSLIQKNQIFYDNKDDINLILEYLYILLFEKINTKPKNITGYINSMQIVQDTKRKLSNSNNYDMTIDNMLIRIWGEINEKNYRG